MELRPGYKQTEVGSIPLDWEVRRLGRLCRLINGRGFKPFEWRKTGLPIIRIQNLNGSEEFNCYTGSYDKKLEVQPEQLLFAWSGSRGTSFGPHIWRGPTGLLNYHTWKVETCEAKVHKEFLAHQLRQLTATIEGSAHGASALVHVQKWQMEGFKIALPIARSEQAAIAEALSDADALLEALEHLLAKKRQIKQGTMQELLAGGKRISSYSGDWEPVQLSRLGSNFSGISGKVKKDFGHGSARYITFTNVMTNVVIDTRMLEHVDIKPDENQNRIVMNDLLFNGSSETPNEVGMCAVVRDDLEDVYLNSFCFGYRLRKDAPVEGLYLAYYLRSQEGRKRLRMLAQGATRYNLSKVALLQMWFPLPSLAEQADIVTIFTDMDTEIIALEKKLAKARSIKQGLMQELLTGRIRLV